MRNARLYPVTLTMVILFTVGLLIVRSHAADSLIWPTPEIDGTVRDLTHLPALPFIETVPDHIQHQQWAQPGAVRSQPPIVIVSPDPIRWNKSFPDRPPTMAENAADRALKELERMK